MKTNFDHTFENKRLDMLKHQFFSNMDVSGEILFRSLDDDHRIDSARFIFDDEINSYIKSSGFKNLIMVLLDDLSSYRYSHTIFPCNGGIVTINHSEISINWLNKNEMNVRFK